METVGKTSQAEKPTNPKERIKSMYIDMVKTRRATSEKLSEVADDIDYFMTQPEAAQDVFRHFIDQTKNELPEAILFKEYMRPSNHRNFLRRRQMDPGEEEIVIQYYLPQSNMIYSFDPEKIGSKLDPKSKKFLGFDAIEEEMIPFGGSDERYNYSQNAPIDSIEGIMVAIKPLLKTEEGKALFQQTSTQIDTLQQNLFSQYDIAEREGIASMKKKVHLLLEETRKNAGDKKMPTYIRVSPKFGPGVFAGDTTLQPEKNALYFLVQGETFVRIPTTVKKGFLGKKDYVPDLSKAKKADEAEWLGSMLELILLDLLPKNIQKELAHVPDPLMKALSRKLK